MSYELPKYLKFSRETETAPYIDASTRRISTVRLTVIPRDIAIHDHADQSPAW